MELVKKRQAAGSRAVQVAGPYRNVTQAEALALASSLRTDKQLFRIDELELLFKAPEFVAATVAAAAGGGSVPPAAAARGSA